MPTDISDSSWRKCSSVTVPGAELHSYTSSATGLRAVLAKTDEPLCAMHLAIATEADTNDYSHKDDGLPHVLEHSTFLGSELYPYKGILDKLANRSLADGTNAWTATDHTCYTLTTAGQRGMLNMLPIYADHIFYPTLTDEGFTTEIHHVTAEGEDKGVVYCEMQGRENDSSSLVDRAVLDLLYPTGGYSAETGGKMKNIRALTIEQVRKYHAGNYRPDNSLLIVSGLVEEADFLGAVVELEKRVLSKQAQSKASAAPPRRPWSGPLCSMAALGVEGIVIGSAPPTSAEATVKGTPRTICFPTEDESVGTVSMAWRGPAYRSAAWSKLDHPPLFSLPPSELALTRLSLSLSVMRRRGRSSLSCTNTLRTLQRARWPKCALARCHPLRHLVVAIVDGRRSLLWCWLCWLAGVCGVRLAAVWRRWRGSRSLHRGVPPVLV